MPEYKVSVFINCPFDDEFAPLLEAMVFCVVRAGLYPRLASERLEAAESRLEKILGLIEGCQYSIHDLSRAISKNAGEDFRMNMPFELGLDLGWRRAPDEQSNDKKFLIFENVPYELKRCLSDLGGQDVAYHKEDHQLVIRKVRDFLKTEAGCNLPGPSAVETDYYTFLGWMTEQKMHEGHTEDEAKDLPTRERIDSMKEWMALGRPTNYETH